MRGSINLKQRFIPKNDIDLYYHYKIFSKLLIDGTSDTTILHPEPAKHYS